MTTTTLHGIRNCDTVKKARAFLEGRGEAYRFHDFKTEGVTESQLRGWCAAVGWERVLNRAGTTFRRLPEEAKTDLSQEKAVRLMLDQPTMIKRPVLEHGTATLFGFTAAAYERLLDPESPARSTPRTPRPGHDEIA